MTIEEYLKLQKQRYSKNLSEEEKVAVETKIKEFNKALLEKYPWLTPTNRWTGKKITDCMNGKQKGFWLNDPDKYPEYDYTYTELDDMPDGWRIAFGDQMCEEIHQELVKFNFLNEYRIVQIKEKYGTLRWYDNGCPSGSKIYDIIDKYEELSEKTCIECGKPAKWLSTGWISPFCDDCKNLDITYIEIKEWQK